MEIIGFSAGIGSREGNVQRLVKSILHQSGHEHSHVNLTDLSYSPCKGCVDLCATPQVCKIEDDLTPYYQKIKEVDAVVLGSAVYFDTLNGWTFSFLERFFGYRHVTSAIKDKPFVLVLAAQRSTENARKEMQRLISQVFRAKVLDVVEYLSYSPPCLSCGRHHECRIGGLYRVRGEAALEVEITPDLFGVWEEEPKTVEAVKRAAEKLRAL
jgi:multimeric flavodoxin WrbA